GDACGAAELRLGRTGCVEHAHALVVCKIIDREPPIVGAGGEHDRACCDLVLLFESYDMSSVAGFERERTVWRRGPRAEFDRLADGAARQLVAADAGREAEIVLDPPRRAG